jgi:hypothetical protein
MTFSRQHLVLLIALAAAGCASGAGEDDLGMSQQGLGIGDSVQAESFTSQQGTVLTNDGRSITSFDSGDYLCYPSLTVDGVEALDIVMAAATSGGVFTVRLDSPTGMEISRHTVAATGGANQYVTQPVSLGSVTGSHSLCLKAESGTGIANIDSFRLVGNTGSFTVVAIPDTQYYAAQKNGGTVAMFTSQTSWIVNNQTSMNIKLATHLGDIVDQGVFQSQYDRAVSAMNILKSSSVPYAILPGNHDAYWYLYIYSYSMLSNYNQNFPVADFSSKAWFGGSYPSGTMDNSYVLFSAAGMDFTHISLGVQGYNGSTIDANARNWAKQILEQYPNRRAIISTHDYMNSSGVDSTGQTLWNDVIKTHPNVFMVLCGHNARQAFVTSTNNAGTPVFQLMSDYQSDTNGGNGWLRYYRFLPASNKIEVWTYSPYLNSYENTSGSRFDIAYQMD